MLRETLDKFKNPEIGKKILKNLLPKLERANDRFGRKLSLMEVCGTHTVSISQTGIRDLLFDLVDLKSGPGCPVCVTDYEDIDWMLALSRRPDVTIATFGDMMRVPGSGGSLAEQKAEGADIRVVYSPLDAVDIAARETENNVVFLGVGFETTTPTIAASLQAAQQKDLHNFYIASFHKVVPPALRVLLEDPGVKIDGFILPGHVSVILGRAAWDFVPRDYHCASAVVGFEAVDILLGIDALVDQLLEGRVEAANIYRRTVTEEGNPTARAVVDKYFVASDAGWRGLGVIPGSGLELRQEFERFNAKTRFPVEVTGGGAPAGCACGEVLKGKIWPYQCPLFGTKCHPVSPVGPCMVSSEGACAAYYRFHRDLKEGAANG